MICEKRLKSLDRTHELYINNCESCKKNIRSSIAACKTCPIGKEMKAIGISLMTRKGKINEVLAKGPDMTKSDIKYLLENDIRRVDIRRAIGMYQAEFQELLSNWGLLKKQEIAEKKLEGVS